MHAFCYFLCVTPSSLNEKQQDTETLKQHGSDEKLIKFWTGKAAYEEQDHNLTKGLQ